MKDFTDILAKIFSVIFYPLFIPTYGVSLFCIADQSFTSQFLYVWMVIAIIGTFLLTCGLPLLAIWIGIRSGQIKDMQISDASERTAPYIYTLAGYLFWCYLMIKVLQMPIYINFVCIGATVAIALVTAINYRWKISAHLTGFGGLFGGLLCFCLGINAIPTTATFTMWFVLSLLFMCARVRLEAHTPAQVCAGWLLGLTCTFIPYCIITYAA